MHKVVCCGVVAFWGVDHSGSRYWRCEECGRKKYYADPEVSDEELQDLLTDIGSVSQE